MEELLGEKDGYQDPLTRTHAGKFRYLLLLRLLPRSVSDLLFLSCLYTFSDTDMQSRHLALSSLFTEALMIMNNASVSTAESLRVSLRGWIDSAVRGLGVMPLLTAACQSLASVRHMAETTEACVEAYFNEGKKTERECLTCVLNFSSILMPLSLLPSPLFWLEDSPLNQELGWGPIVCALQVPELTAEDFLQECLSLGSYLTLYVYTLQQLNSKQTSANEMRVLVTLSKWLDQVYPRYLA